MPCMQFCYNHMNESKYSLCFLIVIPLNITTRIMAYFQNSLQITYDKRITLYWINQLNLQVTYKEFYYTM